MSQSEKNSEPRSELRHVTLGRLRLDEPWRRVQAAEVPGLERAGWDILEDVLVEVLVVYEADAAYARAVSDVVEFLKRDAPRDRAVLPAESPFDIAAEHIEKWAADRKAGT